MTEQSEANLRCGQLEKEYLPCTFWFFTNLNMCELKTVHVHTHVYMFMYVHMEARGCVCM